MMLHINLRKTKPTSICSAIKQYISITYDEDPKVYEEDMIKFENMRNEIIDLPVCNNSVNLLYRYYGQLIFLCAKFPLDENKISVVFSWVPSISKDKKAVNVSSIEYEKACILFNIAAMYSNIATKEDLETPDGIKNACIYYQRSAGIFKFLKDELHGSLKCPVPPDMLPNSLEYLVKLMLAQAQECFWKKAVISKMKNATIAKMAKSASSLYNEAYRIASNNTIFSQEWISYTLSKGYYLNAASLVRFAMINYDQTQFGEQISRLMEAEKQILKIKSFKQYLADDYYEDIKTFTTYIRERIKEEEVNNDKIYMEVVPDFSKLTNVDGTTMVKPIPMPDQKSLESIVGKPLFDCLIPFNYHEIITSYNIRKDNLVQELIGQLKNETQQIESKISSLNIKSSIEALEQPCGLPQTVIERSNIVISKGGLRYIEDTFSRATCIAEENKNLIDEIKKAIIEEENDDMAAKSQFGERWNRPESKTLNQALMDKVKAYEEKVLQAVVSDGIVRSKIDKNVVGIETLSSTKEELEASIPACRPNSGNSSSDIPDISNLKQKLYQFESLISSRKEIIDNLNEFSKNDSINNTVLMLITNKEEIVKDNIINNEIQKYEGERLKITNYIQNLSSLSNEIVELNSIFILKKYQDKRMSERENALKNLEDSYKVFEEICMNLDEGINFYTKINALLKHLQSNVSDFVFARRLDMKERVNDLTANLSNPNLFESSTNRSPPPLPPRTGGTPPQNYGSYPNLNYSQPPPSGGAPQPYYYPYPPSSDYQNYNNKRY